MPARKQTDASAQPDSPAEEKTGEETPAEAETPKQERKQREVGPATKKVIERIRKMREEEGLGFPSIAKRLNDEKVPTFGSGKTWHPPVVRGICLRYGFVKGEKPTKEETPSEA